MNTLFMAVVSAVAVAFALAFGLGGRETAAEIVRKWYAQTQAAAPKIAAASDNASRIIKTETISTRDLPDAER